MPSLPSNITRDCPRRGLLCAAVPRHSLEADIGAILETEKEEKEMRVADMESNCDADVTRKHTGVLALWAVKHENNAPALHRTDAI